MSDELKWCEECKSNHTEDFGKELHDRILFPINLIGDLVAIEPLPAESTVLLPDWKRALKGTVLAVGPESKSVFPGDGAYFGAAVGMDSVFNGRGIRILKEKDIDFIYETEDSYDEA